ncbi:MAG TPA: DsrE family protein [Thiobacillaceae bacterium]|nr:DsrE family protein [Thiobacillaceae bacterium]HNU63403.1 DsrE family protein [Thiobacillaceae bacterium]
MHNRSLPLLLCLSLTCICSAPRASDTAPEADARQMVHVDSRGVYRVVYDIHSKDEAAGISNGLYYARGLYEAFDKQGVKPAQMDVHLVLHGNAAHMLLKDERYQWVVNDPFAVNLNAKIVQDLIQLGASVEICHSTMRSRGWKFEDVLPGVTIVHDGYTRLIKLQNDGYAYIGGF